MRLYIALPALLLAYSMAAAQPVDSCIITGQTITFTGAPAPAKTVYIKRVTMLRAFPAFPESSVKSDANGQFRLRVPRTIPGDTVRVVLQSFDVPRIKTETEFIVPDAPTATLQTLLRAPSVPPTALVAIPSTELAFAERPTREELSDTLDANPRECPAITTYTDGDYSILGFRDVDTAAFNVNENGTAYVTALNFGPQNYATPYIARSSSDLHIKSNRRSNNETFISMQPSSNGSMLDFENNDGTVAVSLDADMDSPSLTFTGTYRGGRFQFWSSDPYAESDLTADHPFWFWAGRSNHGAAIVLGAGDTFVKSRFAVWRGYGTGKIFSIDSSGNVTIGFTNDHLSKRKHMLNVSGTGKFDSSLIALGDVSGATFNGVKVYRALVTQTGTSAPTVTVLENSLGAVVWARADTGTYTATLTNAFVANKTWAKGHIISAATGAVYDLVRTSASVMTLTTRQMPAAPARMDALLAATPVEIRVYP